MLLAFLKCKQSCLDNHFGLEDDPFFLVFDFNSDGNDESVTRVGKTQDAMLSDMYSTSNYKYIWSKRFDAYNLTIKIDLY